MAKSFKVTGTGRIVTGEEDAYKPKSFKVTGTGEVYNGTGTKIQTIPQSNNPSPVSHPGGNNAVSMASADLGGGRAALPKATQTQFGLGFNKTVTKPQPLPYRGPSTLPKVDNTVLQKAQQIGQQAVGKTPAQLRQQNLANINPFNKPAQVNGVGGANAMAGLGQFNSALAKTADFILPDVITPKFVQRGIDYYKNTGDQLSQNAAKVNEEKGVPQWAGQLIQGTVAAVPNAALAMMSGGASLGTQALGQASTGLAGTITTAMQTIAKTPTFYTSLAQTMGPAYEEAKASGASELEAQAVAIIGGFVNAGIEIGGGIETVAANPRSLLNWVRSMVDEGKEEVLQGIVDNLMQKATYDKDKKWVSLTDENAVINPKRMLNEFGAGAAIGGILGGGQMALGAAVDRVSGITPEASITRREQRALDALSQKTGINIQVDNDIEGSNGYFDRNTNTLHISRNSNNAVYQVAAHEITHSIESNPDEWNQLYEIANANLSEDARSKLEYVLQKTGYTDAEMQSEVVSHYVQQCVTDIKSFEQLVGVNRTLAQRIVDAFESFVRKLTGQQNIGNNSDTQYLREIMGDITPEQAQQTLAQMEKALAAGGEATGEGTSSSFYLARDNGAIAQAEQMERDGATRDEIWKATGVIRDTKGNWVSELDDSNVRVDRSGKLYLEDNPVYQRYKEATEDYEGFIDKLYAKDPETMAWYDEYKKLPKKPIGRLTLGDYVAHSELFDLYPDIKKARFGLHNLGDNIAAYYNPFEHKISISQKTYDMLNGNDLRKEEAVRTIMHEIQHAIQEYDRRPSGASSAYWEQKIDNGLSIHKNDAAIKRADAEYRRLFDNAPEAMKNKVRELNRARLAKDYDAVERVTDELYANSEWADLWSELEMADFNRRAERGEELTGRDLYYNTAGEIEARETEARRKMTAEERKNATPDLGWDRAVFAEDTQNSLKLTDSDGNKLTEAQQEYFKDSKVRDENGNLLKVYHSSNDEFTVFDSSKKYRYGQGNVHSFNWAAKDIEYSQGYGDNVHAGYLNITNPLDIGVIDGYYNYDATIQELADAVKLSVEELERMPKGRWNYIYEITNSEAFMNRVVELGYDGVVAWEGEAKTYGFVNSNQFKNADNLNPTADKDIRYSRKLNREALQEMVDRKRAGLPYAPGYVPKPQPLPTVPLARTAELATRDALPKGNEIAPVSDNTSDGYENRVNELRESIKDLGRNRRKKVGGYSVGMYTRNGSDDITISITTPDGDIIRDFVKGGKYWTNSQLQHEIASRIAEAEEYSAEEKQPAQPALPYNPNAPKPIPQNPAQGKFGGNTVGAAESNPSSYSHLQNQHGTIEPGENPSRVVDVPKKDADGNVVSKFSRTMMESSSMPDKLVEPFEDAVASGEFSHVVIRDKDALGYAERELSNGWEHAMDLWGAVVRGEKRATKKDIALGQMLLANAMKDGNTEVALKLAAELCAEATRAGQNVQALRLLKRMTPEGMLYYLQKTAENLGHEFRGRKGFNGITIDNGLVQELSQATTEQQMNEAVDKIKQNIAEQIPANVWDIWNAWRYLAMLGNPTTHIRNIVGNALFAPVISVKNGLAAAIESGVKKANGGQLANAQKATISKRNAADKALMDFAEGDYEAIAAAEFGGDKYSSDKGDILARRQILPGILGKLSDWNSSLLRLEDRWFSRPRYIQSLASYMKANGLTADSMTSEQLTKAREYAIKEAKKATYQDDAALADMIKGAKNKARQFQRSENWGKKAAGYVTEGLVDSLIPFTKTPVNIVKRGLEYSPANIVNVVYDLTQVKSGKKTASDVIDAIASTLTGTGLLALGYALANMGWVTGGGEDDKEDKYRQMLGEQHYSLDVGKMLKDMLGWMGIDYDEERAGTYTIDWLAPEALPFFVGVAASEDVKTGELGLDSFVDALTALGDPIVELSMMSGLNDALNSVSYGNNALSALFSNQVSSYLSQGVPTVGGKFNRTIDKTSRQTYYDPNKGALTKTVDVLAQKTAQKFPFASFALQPRIDAWGRTEENVGKNFVGRLGYNMTSPGYYEKKNETKVDKELLRLHEATGETSILPSYAAKAWKLPKDDGGEKVMLKAKEYTQYAKGKGSKAYDIFDSVIGTKNWNSLSDDEKVEAASLVYKYANAIAKTKVSDYTLTEMEDGKVKKNKDGEVVYRDVAGKIQECEKAGIPAGVAIVAYIAQKDITGDKDRKGNTVPLSASKNKKEAIDKMTPFINKKQRELLYDLFEVSSKVW